MDKWRWDARRDLLYTYRCMCVCDWEIQAVAAQIYMYYNRVCGTFVEREAGGQHFLEPECGLLFSKNSGVACVLIVDVLGRRNGSVWNFSSSSSENLAYP